MCAALEVRRLDRERDDAERLATAAGVHGVYVRNALASGEFDGLVFTPSKGKERSFTVVMEEKE